MTDEVIFEEFQSAANMELRLRGDLAEERLFPAVDVARSGTRREELLMGEEELQVLMKLRRSLADLDPAEAQQSRWPSASSAPPPTSSCCVRCRPGS